MNVRALPWLCTVVLSVGLVGCHLLPTHNAAQKDRAEKREAAAGAPSKHAIRVSQFVFVSDVELRREHPMFKDLEQHREQVYRELRLPPSSTEVFVYLFEDQAKYDDFIHRKRPDLPSRRAYFMAQPRRLGGTEDLVVYTYLGERTHQDLRHELTHAMLHCVLKNVPIWLDEGLAEYFELPGNFQGINAKHVEALREPDVRFDLDRLEKLEEVHQMTPAEYREAWAWVHLMLQSTPQAKQALLGYLQDLRGNPRPGPLRPRLAPAFVSLDAAVQSHLAELDRKLPKNVAVQR
jgi:hypothetical protein